MSRTDYDNYVVIEQDTVTKYSPKKFVDFSIELEYVILKHLERVGIKHVPFVQEYRFDATTMVSSIKMQRIKGKLLLEVLNEPLQKTEAYNLLLNILYALTEIHEQDVTHGDMHGENIILVETDSPTNVWTVGGSQVEIPSMGRVPVIIDFGLSHYPNSLFRADMSVSYAGVITSMQADKLGDIIGLLRAMRPHPMLWSLLETLVAKIPQDFDEFGQLSHKIRRFLKQHPYTKQRVTHYLSAELFNLIRCFPAEPLESDVAVGTAVRNFMSFLAKYHDKEYSSHKLCNKIKKWHFEKHTSKGLQAGASLIIYLIDMYTPGALAEVMEHRKSFPYRTTTEVIAYVKREWSKPK